MTASETMTPMIDYQVFKLEDIVYNDLISNEELTEWDTVKVQKIFKCSRATAWRILQECTNRGMFTKHYVAGKKMQKCVYRAHQDYEGWYRDAI